MRTFKVEIDANGWAGYVVLKPIGYEDKMEFLESHGDTDQESNASKIKTLRAMTKSCEPYIVEINLTKEAETCKSFEEMKEIPELHGEIPKIAAMVFNGKMGNG